MSYNREKEVQNKINHQKAWKLSQQYSHELVKNLDHKNISEVVDSIYGQYISELKSRGLLNNHKNYVQVWETMVNTVQTNKKLNIRRGSIKLLHQTSVQRSYKH
jgi:hypothetical protein